MTRPFLYFALITCFLPILNGCVSSKVYSQGEMPGPYKDYEAACEHSITQKWYRLLNNHKFARPQFGKVVLQCQLNYDGSITNMKVIKRDVGDELSAMCQKAVLAAAPFPPWPKGMIHSVGTNYYVVTFTFRYTK